MLSPFVSKTKTELLVLVFFTVCVTTIALLALTFHTIYTAQGVSEKTTVRIHSPSEINSPDIVVTRMSRGGALFPIDRNMDDAWETTEWVRAFEIQTDPTETTDSIVTVTVGSDVYDLPLSDLPHTNANSREISQVTISELGRTPTKLPFFTTILNWPGNTTALMRALHHNLLSLLILFVGCFASISIYQYWMRQSTVNTISPQSVKIFTLILSAILASISMLLFIHNGPTAYDWPALDMGPYFTRAADPNFLPHDFFTNASMATNPRHIFGYTVIALTHIFNLSWYGIFFLIKTAMIVFLPPLLLVSLASFFESVSGRQKSQILFGLFIAILLALFPFWIGQFTIALWSPYVVTPTPHAVAFCSGLIAIFFINTGRRKFGALFLAITTLLLPTIGLSVFGFFCILTWQKLTKRDAIYYFGLGIILPTLVLALFFTPSIKLAGADFVYHYITSNHSIHYLPSAFETSPYSPLPWYIHFCILIVSFGSTALIGYRKKNSFIFTTSLLSLLSYTGAVAFCFFFIELYPIRIVAIIGPSRFTLYGYWLLGVILAYGIAQIPGRFFPWLNLLRYLNDFNYRTIRNGLFIVLILFVGGITLTYRDNPTEKWLLQNEQLAEYINQTAPDDVFATNIFDLAVNIPLSAHRSVFSGNGFPFREDYFEAFDSRRALLYGSPEDWANLSGNSDRIKSDNFYRHLTPANFTRIAGEYRLDYVIIESSFSEQFSAYTPVFANAEMKIYKVSDFN